MDSIFFTNAIIFLEKDLEAAKVNLALKHDFNTIDAFRLFDRNNLGCVTPEDLMEGLRFNLHFADFHHDDILMLMKGDCLQEHYQIIMILRLNL